MVKLGMGTPTYAAQPPVTKHAMPALCLQGAVINKQTRNEYTEELKPPAKRGSEISGLADIHNDSRIKYFV
jgi:hypothetical protein